MPETPLPWKRYALIRLGLGVSGILAALLLGQLFMVIWHWIALVVLWLFIGHGSGWIYAWDAIFLVALIWEGYHYKQRMPPPSPFTRTEQIVSITLTGHTLTTPAHIGFAGAEILYVAPRLFFWGWRHLMRVAWLASDLAETIDDVYDYLKGRGTWRPFNDVKHAFPNRDIAERSVALLVKVGVAEGAVSKGTLRFRVIEPEWI